MKSSLDRRTRIPRTFVPSSRGDQPASTADVTFFYKIKGGNGLLQKYDPDRPARAARHSLTNHKFYLSKRLQNLSRVRPVRRDLVSEGQASSARRRLPSQRATVRQDEAYDLQIANINKTISGTRLGALSALQIMEQLQGGEGDARQGLFYGFDRLVKRMDSDFAEESSYLKKGEKTQKLAVLEGRTVERRMESIYEGAQGFLQKYREYQMSLLQKVPSYKSRHLTLDYKNEWRI